MAGTARRGVDLASCLLFRSQSQQACACNRMDAAERLTARKAPYVSIPPTALPSRRPPFCFLLSAFCFPIIAFFSGTASAQSLTARIDPLLANAQLKSAQVSMHIVEITAKGTVDLYDHNGSLPLPPASCCKLLTTTAAFSAKIRSSSKAAFNDPAFQSRRRSADPRLR